MDRGAALIQRGIVKRSERGEDCGSEGILAVDQIQGEDAPRATGSPDSRSRELIDHVAQLSTLEYVTRNRVRQHDRSSGAEAPTRPLRDRRPCLQYVVVAVIMHLLNILATRFPFPSVMSHSIRPSVRGAHRWRRADRATK